MKFRYIVIALIVLILFSTSCSEKPKNNKAEEKLIPQTEQDKTSYSVGYRTGVSLRGMVQNKDISLDMALQGLKDATSAQPQLDEKELVKLYTQFKKTMEKRKVELEKLQAEKNRIEGEKFLSLNALKEGVLVTASGLQYKILQEGTGPVPKDTDIAVVHYKGSLVDGKEIYSSYFLREPVKLPVQRSLPAWKEALKLMKVGTKFILYIPPDLAYKNHGRPPNIGPNCVLIYEGELVGIET